MRKITIIAKLIKWGLRSVLFITITCMLLDRGMDIIYSLICATVFMIFWLWLMWTDYKINPIVRYDENGV